MFCSNRTTGWGKRLVTVLLIVPMSYFILFSLTRALARMCVCWCRCLCMCVCSLQLFLSNPSTLVGFFSFTFFFLNCFRSFLITSYLHTCILSYNLQKSTFVFLFSLLFFIYYPALGYPRSVQIPSRNFFPHAF